MTLSKVELAALNNGWWYETVFRAHRIPIDVRPLLWWSDHPAPPFHSNLGVLSPDTTQRDVEPHIERLLRVLGSRHWSVKDSFSCLDLSALGFRQLFEARWIWRDADEGVDRSAAEGLSWSRVGEPAELLRWEEAWLGDPGNAQAAPSARQFPDQLLTDPRVAFFAGRKRGAISAGGIANASPGAVGLSNVFSPADLAGAAWAGLVHLTRRAFPDRPIVGYERESALEHACEIGFRPIGALRVLCIDKPTAP